MSKVSDDARNFLRQWQSLSAFATSAVEMGDIEQQTNDLKSEQEILKKRNDDYNKENDDLISRCIDLKKQNDELEAKIADTVSSANDEAANIIRAVEQDAVIRKQKALDEIVDMKNKADKEQQAATDRINNINDEISILQKQKTELEDAIATLKSKFV